MSRINTVTHWLRPKSRDAPNPSCLTFLDNLLFRLQISAKNWRNVTKTWWSIGGMILLAACSTADARTIGNDRGGYVIKYALAVLKAPSNEEVRITGTCMSACTLWIAHPRACIGKRAKLVFHAATTEAGTRFLMTQYPAWARTWITNNGGLSKRLLTMNGKVAGKYMRRCR